MRDDITARNEKGYDEMVSLLGRYGFRPKNGSDYWVKDDDKVELIKDKNTIKVIKLDEEIRSGLEYIAETEARSF